MSTPPDKTLQAIPMNRIGTFSSLAGVQPTGPESFRNSTFAVHVIGPMWLTSHVRRRESRWNLERQAALNTPQPQKRKTHSYEKTNYSHLGSAIQQDYDCAVCLDGLYLHSHRYSNAYLW
jgi:hypothetical protein